MTKHDDIERSELNQSDMALTEPVVVVAPELIEQILKDSRSSLILSVVVQLSVGLTIAFVAYFIAGMQAAMYALAGSAAYALPNALLAFIVVKNSKRANPNASVMLIGEFLKLAIVVVCFMAIVQFGGTNVSWLALLTGWVLTLKSYWVMLIIISIKK